MNTLNFNLGHLVRLSPITALANNCSKHIVKYSFLLKLLFLCFFFTLPIYHAPTPLPPLISFHLSNDGNGLDNVYFL